MTHANETHEPIAHGPSAPLCRIAGSISPPPSRSPGRWPAECSSAARPSWRWSSPNRMSGHLLLLASATLFALGAVLGMVHGVILGVVGRPEGTTPRQAWSAMVHGLLYLVPALLLGWLIAGWVAAMPIALNGGHVVAAVISAFAWVGMILTVYFAGSTGLHALSLAYRRWPERVPGTVMVGATLAALIVAFAVEPPTIWFTDIRLTMPGALVLALAATFWFYGPIITFALSVMRKVLPLFPASQVLDRVHAWRGVLVRVGIALAVGVGIALLALPFHKGALGLPTDVERFGLVAAMGKSVADAVTDELLLRLFVFTAALAIAIRYLPEREAVGGRSRGRGRHHRRPAPALAVGQRARAPGAADGLRLRGRTDGNPGRSIRISLLAARSRHRRGGARRSRRCGGVIGPLRS